MKSISRFFVRAGLSIFGVMALSVTTVLLIYHLPLPAPGIVPEGNDLFISNINIVDIESGSVRPTKNVLITDGQIRKISPARESPDFPEHKFVDGSDKYLMPGLWDMHTHSLQLSPVIHHPLFIRFGVTSVRDMSGCLNRMDPYWACPADRRRWSQGAMTGRVVSPVYHQQSSYQTNGGNEVPDGYPDYFRLNQARDAIQLVEFYESQGVDFIKTYTELSADQFQWLAQATSGKNIQLAGHIPLKVSLEEVITSNMASIEHGRLFAFACYEEISEFRNMPDPLSSYNAEKIRDIVSKQDNPECDRLMAVMADSGTAWVPTLTTLRMSAESRREPIHDAARLDFIPSVFIQLIWKPDRSRAANSGFDDDGKFVHADYYALVQRQIKKSHEHGVRILVGTDNIDTMVFSGLSVHEEMQQLVESGLTAGEALLAATLLPARFSGVDTILGTVAEGKRADLLLLSSNPLVDIGNTQSIEAVMVNGHYYDQRALAALERYAVEMAQSIRVNVKLLGHMLLSPLMRAQLAD